MREQAEKFMVALEAAVKAAEKVPGSFNAEVRYTDSFMGVRFTLTGGWEAVYQPTGSGFMCNPDWTGKIPAEILAEAERAASAAA